MVSRIFVFLENLEAILKAVLFHLLGVYFVLLCSEEKYNAIRRSVLLAFRVRLVVLFQKAFVVKTHSFNLPMANHLRTSYHIL